MKHNSKNIDFEELFRYWYRPLCLYGLHYLDDLGQVEDIVQECYISLWEKKDSVDTPKSYLYAAVRNRCLDELCRKSHGTYRGVTDLTVADEMEADMELQEDSVTEARIWTAIDSLPDRCREIFLLSKRDGLKYEEIAQELGISINTVRNQMSKALHILHTSVKRIILFIFG